MRRGLFDVSTAGCFELCAAENIAATHHQSNLATQFVGAFDLARDGANLFHVDAAFTRSGEAFPGKL